MAPRRRPPRHGHLPGAAAACALLALACTTIQVQPYRGAAPLDHVCIQHNPAVRVGDFVDVIRARLSHHGIGSEVFWPGGGGHCEYVLTYTAHRSWDFVTYLAHAELYLQHEGRQVASGIFHLQAGGGFDLGKYRSTKSKMDPVIDRLIGASAGPSADPDQGS